MTSLKLGCLNLKLHLYFDSGIECGEGLIPCPGPSQRSQPNHNHITPKQYAVSELNDFSDHIDDASVERVNMF